MGYVIAMVNMKGGVGKTTVTVNLATAIAKNYHKRVLVVDLDIQINATLSLMPPLQFAKLKQEHRTLKSLIHNNILRHSPLSIEEIIQRNICQVKGLDLLPGDIDLYEDFALAEIVYSQSAGEKNNFQQTWNQMEDRLLKDVLQPIIDKYDFIFMDFSPGDHLITRSGILASNFYVIPAKAEPLSVVGIGILDGRIKQLKDSKRTKIKLIGIVFTSLGRITNLADNVKQRLSQDFGQESLFATEIPVNVAIARAVDEFKPVVINEPQSPGAKAFNLLAREFLEKFVNLLKK
jgi:cellulose biosynthesis protein BcsQ